jgi:pyruvate/2-oxoglutarate/acetoin dehydrogenase E1 component
MLTLDKGDVPEGNYAIPLDVAKVKRAGSDITIVATGWMVKKSLAAAERLSKEGISAELMLPDLKSGILRLDMELPLLSWRLMGTSCPK